MNLQRQSQALTRMRLMDQAASDRVLAVRVWHAGSIIMAHTVIGACAFFRNFAKKGPKLLHSGTSENTPSTHSSGEGQEVLRPWLQTTKVSSFGIRGQAKDGSDV